MYEKCIKRIFDFTLSFCALIVLFPFLLVLCLVIKIKLGSPVIFKQARIGKGEKVFNLYKFRTMTDEKDENGNLLPDSQRLTKIGRFLRSTSIDELPELINIIKGDLSIIGPRPLIVSYLPFYTDEERHRHDVRGGLVPPEVLYNNIQPSWEEQLSYEAYYAQNVTFILDFKIFLSTIKGLFNRSSVDYGSYVRESLITERTEKETVGVNK